MLQETKDFQDTLHELLDTKLKTKNEVLLQSILAKTEPTANNDFQNMLRKSIKPLYYDKTKKEIEKENIIKSKKNSEEQSKNSVEHNIGHEVKLGTDINKVVNDIDNETDKDKGEVVATNSNDEQLTKRQQALKYMYSTALDEYYKLREDLYKHQIKDNDIALDDKNYLKLLQYENYLRKCDSLFKSSYGSYISNQDKSISDKENKYVYEAAKSEKKLVTEHENKTDEINSLNDEIENKANEIMELNEAAKNGNIESYEQKLDILEKEYVALNVKMHMLKPNILELYRQEEKKEDQDKTTTRIVGTMYEKEKRKKVLDVDVVRLDKKVENKEKTVDDAAKTEKTELQKTNIELANSYIDAAEVALEKNDVNDARVMVNKAKELVGYSQVESMSNDKNSDFSELLKSNVNAEGDDQSKPQVVNNQTVTIDNYLGLAMAGRVVLSPVQKECIKAVNTPEERDKNALAREAKEEIERTSKEKNLLKDKEKVR